MSKRKNDSEDKRSKRQRTNLGFELLRACKTDKTELAQILIERDVPLEETDKFGDTPLLWPCHHNNMILVSTLID